MSEAVQPEVPQPALSPRMGWFVLGVGVLQLALYAFTQERLVGLFAGLMMVGGGLLSIPRVRRHPIARPVGWITSVLALTVMVLATLHLFGVIDW